MSHVNGEGRALRACIYACRHMGRHEGGVLIVRNDVVLHVISCMWSQVETDKLGMKMWKQYRRSVLKQERFECIIYHWLFSVS